MKALFILAALITVGCSSSTAPTPVAPTLPKPVIDCTLVGILPCQQPPPVTPTAPKPTPGQTTGSVHGTVTDGTSGGILPNITIAASTGATTHSDAAGRFQFSDVPIGPFNLIVSAESYIRQNVNANVVGETTVDVILQRVPASPPPPPPTPRPIPTPIPTPTPTPVPPAFVVSISCAPGAHGSATGCNVIVNYSGALVPSAQITSVIWDLGAGFTTTTVQPSAPIVSHVYVGGGMYPVFATVTATINGVSVTGSSVTTVTIA